MIDYKSSSKDFEPALFMEGIQLQLMVYMSVAMDTRKGQVNDKAVRPAGVFYYTIDNPFVEKDEKLVLSMRKLVDNTDEGEIKDTQDNANVEIEKGILDKLTMKGIVNSDPVIIEQIDDSMVDNGTSFIPKMKSDVIKISTNTRGDIKSGANAISDNDFKALIGKTTQIIKETVIDMNNGCIEKNPYKFGDKTPCEYCDYKSICNFDINLEDNNYKRISKKTMDEILDVLNPKDDI